MCTQSRAAALALGVLTLASCTDNGAPTEPSAGPNQPTRAELAVSANRWEAKQSCPPGDFPWPPPW